MIASGLNEIKIARFLKLKICLYL